MFTYFIMSSISMFSSSFLIVPISATVFIIVGFPLVAVSFMNNMSDDTIRYREGFSINGFLYYWYNMVVYDYSLTFVCLIYVKSMVVRQPFYNSNYFRLIIK